MFTAVVLGLAACGGGKATPEPDAAVVDEPERAFVTQVLVAEGIHERRLAFGTHPAAEPDDDSTVDQARTRFQTIHIVFSTTVSGLSDGGDELIEGSAHIVCDGEPMLPAPDSYYTPFGSQNTEFLQALGPALFIHADLRSSASCTIALADTVVGPDGHQPCAPPGGRTVEDCTPGDLSRISFGTEPLHVTGSSPADGWDNIAHETSAVVQFNHFCDSTTTSRATLSGPDGVVATGEINANDPTLITLEPSAPLAPSTNYVVTVPGGPSGVLDELGGHMAADHTISFTTRP